MNICIVTSEFPSPFSGGVERVSHLLHKTFLQRGHNVYVLSKDAPHSDDEMLANHYILPPLKNNNTAILLFFEDFFRLHQIEYVINNSHHISIFNFLNYIRKQYPFVLLTCIHSDPEYLLKGLRDQWNVEISKSPIINRILLPYYFVIYGVRYWKRKKILTKKYEYLYEGSTRIVLLSNSFIPVFKRYLPSSTGNKLIAISNMFEIESTSFNISKDRIILWIGRMEMNAKRPDRMVKIWEQLYRLYPKWHLYLLGEGPLRVPLEVYCKKNCISNIHFTGQTNPVPFLKRACILCSTSTYEGFGLVLTEAQSFGVIPLAFDSYAAIHDILTDGETGYLIPPYSISKYVKKLSKLMEQPELIIRLQHHIYNQKPYMRFSPSLIAEKWETVMEDCSIMKCNNL